MFHLPYAKNSGLVMLANVVIIAVAGVLLGAALMILGLYSTRNSSNFIRKNQGLALNNACVEEALYQIKVQSSYTGTANVTLDNKTCSYTVTNLGGEIRKVAVSSNIAGVITKTQVWLNVSSVITISSWQEVADF